MDDLQKKEEISTNLLIFIILQKFDPAKMKYFMLRNIIGQITKWSNALFHDPLSYFSFQPVLHDWCNKGRGMCYPVCGMVHI